MSDPITVLIVDDHEVVRQGLRTYLEATPGFQVVAEAASGEKAVALAEEFIPDVVLMDLILTGMDGVESTRKIKDISLRTQIVVLTSFYDDQHIFPAL
jgi:DNA-binding NarL/FixJ family response regulator